MCFPQLIARYSNHSRVLCAPIEAGGADDPTSNPAIARLRPPLYIMPHFNTLIGTGQHSPILMFTCKSVIKPFLLPMQWAGVMGRS